MLKEKKVKPFEKLKFELFGTFNSETVSRHLFWNKNVLRNSSSSDRAHGVEWRG